MKILVVGATGKMGSKVVQALVGAAEVRVTTRKPESVAALQALGAEVVTADLADEASLARACAGVQVVVSTVQGLRDVIVDGQGRLLRAAERAGVSRMLPSDYALDFFKTTEGGNRNLDLRREFDRTLDGSRVRGTSLLCGAFMDLLAIGAIGPDRDGVFKVWGDPDQPYDFTLTDDVARYIAAVALDADSARVVRVAGDTKSPRELAAIFQEVRGAPVTIQSAGSLADLEQLIARMRADDASVFPPWQQLQYVRDMASGKGRLTPLDNVRYAAIRPKTVRELLGRRADAA
jgi:uncharacterized protein YbjT (DUF2867 family)